MKPNVGNTERIIRVIIGVVLLSLLFVLEGNMRYLGLIGIIPIVTAAVSWCPVWALLGINTCPATRAGSG
ncbi:MAG: DUF2892 domain-containing protein [Gammaproteobacteria bacterium]|nr:MAG: DUF2892 domain-containing protein [Gammaproteobacteria bacterium]